MKKIIVAIMAIFALSIVTTPALATSVDVSWTNAGSINTGMSNSNSEISLSGDSSTSSLDGEFHAWDGNYERVEGWTEATYQDGGYSVTQTNNLKSGEDSTVGAWTSGDSGFVDIKTDEWRTGNDLKPHGYGGHGWSGTDSPAVGASGNDYEVGIGAMHDVSYTNGDGPEPTIHPVADSSYFVTVEGTGSAGIGTWNAGSTDVVQSGGHINGNVLVKGEGSGSATQNFNNVGNIHSEFHWE